MKKTIYISGLLIFLYLTANHAFGQKLAKDNFFRISKSYLQYAIDNYHLDSNTIVFQISVGSYKNDSIFFDISFNDVNLMYDVKYRNIYKLENYKLIIYDSADKNSTILKKIFSRAPYENLNKGKKDEVIRDDFRRWNINLNNKYEITSVDAAHPKKAVNVLRKNKVRFSKGFKFLLM